MEVGGMLWAALLLPACWHPAIALHPIHPTHAPTHHSPRPSLIPG